jgi:EmrB/QacA subfamily drug resistance transporter
MRGYLIFACAGLSLLMHAMDVTMVAVALPDLMKDFSTNVLWAGWTVSIYLLAVTSVMPLMGTLSDSLGRKKVFLFSLGLFTGSSLACGLAPNVHSLVAFRFLQGLGGASFLPTASGIVSDQFPEHRERAIGLLASVLQIGGVIGPNLGGWIVSRYSWRYLFYINLPIGIGLIVLITVLLKGSEILSRPRIDVWGASLLSGTVLFLMLGLGLTAEGFSMSSLPLAMTFGGISLSSFFLFLRQEKKAPHPIVDMVLLKAKPFLAANLYNMVTGAGILGVFAFIPLFATTVLGLSTLVSGMILTPRSLAIIPVSVVTSFLLKRSGYRWPMVLGVSIISLATILLGLDPHFWREIGLPSGVVESVALIVMLSGVGCGIAFPACNNACIELMPEKVATMTGLRGMFLYVGGALGISLITVILHLSSTPAHGFKIAYISFGILLLLTIPLVFFMPAGKKRVQTSGSDLESQTNPKG